jgi:hypothetical protein
MNTKPLWLMGIALGMVTQLATQDADAGMKYTSPVDVTPASRYASGGIGYARNTSTTNDYIGCNVLQSGTGAPSMYCSARDTGNEATSCTSTDIKYVEMVRSMGMDSHISFYSDTTGKCTYLRVEYYSWNQPKAL